MKVTPGFAVRWIVICFLPIISFGQVTNGPFLFTKMHKKEPVPASQKIVFIEVGGGMAPWYDSDQRRMNNLTLPVQGFIEYGTTTSPWRLAAGITTRTQFQQKNFVLQPRHVFLYGKYVLPPFVHSSTQFTEVYGLAGVQGWRANLSEQPDPDQLTPNLIAERDQGIGAMVGVGGRYYFRSLGIGAQLQRFIGQGKFAVGGDDKVNARVGSSQLVLSLSYRFGLFDPVRCPTF